ncbi:RNA-dependent RNA polymerase [Hymenoscyphus fraxineus partitivirus 1]|nr:RNA-dependent RNA polymerase [Hymenoscyphus fraxineus partitivirus 1]
MPFSIYTLATLFILIRFQLRRRRKQTTPELEYQIRNVLYEWELRSTFPRANPRTGPLFDYSKSLLHFIDLATCKKIKDNIGQSIVAIRQRYTNRDEPFAIREPLDFEALPSNRIPENGIHFSGFRYHKIASADTPIDESSHLIEEDKLFTETTDERSRIIYDSTVDLSGQPAHPEIQQIIHDHFPEFLIFLDEYCRPPSFGPQAFRDFNRPTAAFTRPSPERHEDIMDILRKKFNIVPYRPLHFVDALAADTPLSTSSSYFTKHDPRVRVLANYSTPVRYKDKPTSKGYSFNTVMNTFRTEFHHVKYTRYPFPTSPTDPQNAEKLQQWFLDHPSQLFIRTQISKRDPDAPKKIRPVYSVDERFLHVEKTLITPALAQMRNPQCCVAHGMETFRGAMSLLDKIALRYESFISLDWSHYDQLLPYYVIIAFYLDFLPSLLIISHGYMPSRGYHDTKQDPASFATKIFNTLIFLVSWYLSMTYLSYDGFAYIRDNGGVPSGLLATQLLDSFGNMYIILDCMLEFGFNKAECLAMLFYVLGDDNLIFTLMHIRRITDFMHFMEEYANKRHGMVLSVLKSVYTHLRTKITFLSYENNYGLPSRPIGKLVAQLAFPERPPKPGHDWIHAARALGLAYANCGQDHRFHNLCELVYNKFKPTTSVPTHHVSKIFKKWQYQLPKEFEIKGQEYTFPDFPSLHEIRDLVKDYHGSLHEHDKWNFELFDSKPSDTPPDYVTLKDHIKDHRPEMSSIINEFWHGKRSI